MSHCHRFEALGSRRDFLGRFGMGLGAAAFGSLVARDHAAGFRRDAGCPTICRSCQARDLSLSERRPIASRPPRPQAATGRAQWTRNA